MFPLRCAVVLVLVLTSSYAKDESQAGAGPPRPTTPRYIELLAERQVATLHFPAGRYFLYGFDKKGFYYRAPRPVLQHTGGGSVVRNGGIFVNRRDPNKLRGYVYLAGRLTHVGDLSDAPHEFGD